MSRFQTIGFGQLRTSSVQSVRCLWWLVVFCLCPGIQGYHPENHQCLFGCPEPFHVILYLDPEASRNDSQGQVDCGGREAISLWWRWWQILEDVDSTAQSVTGCWWEKHCLDLFIVSPWDVDPQRPNDFERLKFNQHQVRFEWLSRGFLQVLGKTWLHGGARLPSAPESLPTAETNSGQLSWRSVMERWGLRLAPLATSEGGLYRRMLREQWCER